MTARWAAGVAAVIILASGGCGDDGAHPRPRTVEVRAGGCSLVDELAVGSVVGEGLVLTVAHVLRGASSVRVDGRRGDVVALDHRIDAALIAADLDAAPAEFADSPQPGAADLPDGPVRVTRVVDANVDEPRDDTTYQRHALVLDGDVVKGESGSPVVAPDGSMLGMVFATSTGQEHVAYAVSSTELAPFVATAGTETVDTGDC